MRHTIVVIFLAALIAPAELTFTQADDTAAATPPEMVALANAELDGGNAAGALSLLEEARVAADAALLSRADFWVSMATARLCANDDIDGARDAFRRARILRLESVTERPCRNDELQALFALVHAEQPDMGAEARTAAPNTVSTSGTTLSDSAPEPAESSEPGAPDLDVLDADADSLSSELDEEAHGDDADESIDEETDRAYLEAGVVLGLGWVSTGLPADRSRPRISESQELGAWESCDGRGDDCDVRVESPGVGTQLGVRIAALFPVADRLYVGGGIRFSRGGSGFVSGLLFEGVFRWNVFRKSRVRITTGVSVGVGQIQYQPDQAELASLNIEAPYVKSGLGWASLLLLFSHEITSGVAIYGELVPRISFPDFLPVLDVGFGLRFTP